MEDTERSIREFIRKNFVLIAGAGDLPANQSLMESGVVDSTGVLELTGFLEERFGFKVEDEELVPENLDSISSIVSFVRRKSSLAGGTP